MRRFQLEWPALCLACVVALTLVVYWVGLNGPFLLDDNGAFAVVKSWLEGKHSLRDVLIGNSSWLTHRTLAMGSFAASAWVHGYHPFGFKLDNLLLHVANGVVLYFFLRSLLRHDATLASNATVAALLISSIWLLHPLQVSTVLYAVQRMAQWAALCCLLGLWFYVVIRERLEKDASIQAVILLFLGIPLLTILGIQGKQNAVVLPALCFVVELAWFAKKPRPKIVKTFFLLFLAAPTLLGILLLALRPDSLLAPYHVYEFSPWQRLISEARVLCDYIRQLVVPYTPSMGISTDDYSSSTSLFSPISTLFSVLAIGAVSFLVCVYRQKYPALFGGWFFFLVAHSVEGSILPLELYYEHRNYLPSVGIFVVCAALIVAASECLSNNGIRIGRVGIVGAMALIALLSAQTHGRARVWSDAFVLHSMELKHHPNSIRAIISNVGIASDIGQTDRAYEIAARSIETASTPRLQGQIMLFRLNLDCIHRRPANLEDVKEAVSKLVPFIDTTSFHIINLLAGTVASGKCETISTADMGLALSLLADQSVRQSEQSLVIISTRNRAALLYRMAGRWDLALQQACRGWQPITSGPASETLIDMLLITGRLTDAEVVYTEAMQRARGNTDAEDQVKEFGARIEAEKRTPGSAIARLTKKHETN